MEEQKLPSQAELNSIWRGIDPDLPDYRFEWSASRTHTAGTIYYRTSLIRLSVKHYLEFGMASVTDTLRHEAAHYLAWFKHGDRGHGKWLWYYLGKLGSERHCQALSASMKTERIKIVGQRRSSNVTYDPVTKKFRQV